MSSSAKKPLILPLFAGAVRPEWPRHRLDEIADVYDCPHSTPALVEDTSAPFVVRSQDVRSGSFLTASAARVSQDTYADRIKRVEPRFGDLVYSREGTYFGIAAEVPRGIKVCLGQRMVLIRPDAGRIDHSFLKYWLNSPLVFGHIHGFRDGTVAERLNLPVIRGLPVALPSVAQQGEMAETLTALDDRIALLRETNATLEAIAQALFKSWFVDFDPVHAKQQGRIPEGAVQGSASAAKGGMPIAALDEATAALFPDSFEESELGLVPRGWKSGILGEELKIAYGKNLPTSKLLESGYPVFGGNGRIGFFDKFIYETRQVLVACRGAASGKVNQSSPRAFVTNNSLVLESNESTLLPFGYLKGYMLRSDLIPFVTGSAQPQVTIDNLKNFKILMPSTETLSAYESFSCMIEDRIEENTKQAQTLDTLRDTLLPV